MTQAVVAQDCCDGKCNQDCCQGLWAPLIDVTNVPMSDLLNRVDGADISPQLARSVRRLVESLDDPNGVISAFSSFVE